MASQEAGPVSLFAFAGPEAIQQWQAVNNGVMGGVSEGRFRITPDKTMEFSGTLSLENNGRFASVRTKPKDLSIEAGDAIVVRVKGDGREYVLNPYTKSRRMAFSYRAPLPTKQGEWTEVSVPLTEFMQTAFGRRVAGIGPVQPDDITGLGFMLSYKKPGPFTLEIESWPRCGPKSRRVQHRVSTVFGTTPLPATISVAETYFNVDGNEFSRNERPRHAFDFRTPSEVYAERR